MNSPSYGEKKHAKVKKTCFSKTHGVFKLTKTRGQLRFMSPFFGFFQLFFCAFLIFVVKKVPKIRSTGAMLRCGETKIGPFLGLLVGVILTLSGMVDVFFQDARKTSKKNRKKIVKKWVTKKREGAVGAFKRRSLTLHYARVDAF